MRIHFETSMQVILKHKHCAKPSIRTLPMASTLWAQNSIPGKNPHTCVPFLVDIEHTQSPEIAH